MAMTRKDYELIAKTISELPAQFDAEIVEGMTLRRLAAVEFAYELEQTNPRFDRERFVKACLKKD